MPAIYTNNSALYWDITDQLPFVTVDHDNVFKAWKVQEKVDAIASIQFQENGFLVLSDDEFDRNGHVNVTFIDSERKQASVKLEEKDKLNAQILKVTGTDKKMRYVLEFMLGQNAYISQMLTIQGNLCDQGILVNFGRKTPQPEITVDASKGHPKISYLYKTKLQDMDEKYVGALQCEIDYRINRDTYAVKNEVEKYGCFREEPIEQFEFPDFHVSHFADPGESCIPSPTESPSESE